MISLKIAQALLIIKQNKVTPNITGKDIYLMNGQVIYLKCPEYKTLYRLIINNLAEVDPSAKEISYLPENRYHTPNANSDIYLFSIILYELITGQQAYRGITGSNLWQQIKHHRYPSMPTTGDPLLLALLSQCWLAQLNIQIEAIVEYLENGVPTSGKKLTLFPPERKVSTSNNTNDSSLNPTFNS